MDLDILLFFQSIRSAPLDALMSAVTWLGSELVAVPVICTILWCVDRSLGYRLGMTLFFTQGLNQTLKVLFAVPRPWVRWPGTVSPVGSAVAEATGYSFPSGHTSTAAALYPVLAWKAFPERPSGRRGARARWVATAAAAAALILTGISRMYLGVHTPSDVVVSALLTLAVVVPVNLLYDRIERERFRPGTVLAGGCTAAAVVLAAASWVYATGGPDASEQALDAFKAAGAMAGFCAGWYTERRWIRFEPRASLPVQAIKVVFGIGMLLAVKEGTKPMLQVIVPFVPAADALRYALVAIWATCGLPAAASGAARAMARLRRLPRRG